MRSSFEIERELDRMGELMPMGSRVDRLEAIVHELLADRSSLAIKVEKIRIASNGETIHGRGTMAIDQRIVEIKKILEGRDE